MEVRSEVGDGRCDGRDFGDGCSVEDEDGDAHFGADAVEIFDEFVVVSWLDGGEGVKVEPGFAEEDVRCEGAGTRAVIERDLGMVFGCHVVS